MMDWLGLKHWHVRLKIHLILGNITHKKSTDQAVELICVLQFGMVQEQRDDSRIHYSLCGNRYTFLCAFGLC